MPDTTKRARFDQAQKTLLEIQIHLGAAMAMSISGIGSAANDDRFRAQRLELAQMVANIFHDLEKIRGGPFLELAALVAEGVSGEDLQLDCHPGVWRCAQVVLKQIHPLTAVADAHRKFWTCGYPLRSHNPIDDVIAGFGHLRFSLELLKDAPWVCR